MFLLYQVDNIADLPIYERPRISINYKILLIVNFFFYYSIVAPSNASIKNTYKHEKFTSRKRQADTVPSLMRFQEFNQSFYQASCRLW